MRNMSFMLTTEQIKNKTKFVTRRDRWLNAKAGDVVMACMKCMGLKKGEKVKKIRPIRFTNVRREPLNRMLDSDEYGRVEVVNEGFPEMTAQEFVDMYCKHNKRSPDYVITRLEFEYIDDC